MARIEVKTKTVKQHQENKFVPDLPGFIGQCERNYILLQGLMNTKYSEDCWQFNIDETHLRSHIIEIKIIERCPYTTFIKITHIIKNKVSEAVTTNTQKDKPDSEPFNKTNSPQRISEPEMSVRLYHDAKMAEVISYQSIAKVQPSYTYPNKKMHQKNEKAQWSKFLGEWLSHCIKSGYCSQTPINF